MPPMQSANSRTHTRFGRTQVKVDTRTPEEFVESWDPIPLCRWYPTVREEYGTRRRAPCWKLGIIVLLALVSMASIALNIADAAKPGGNLKLASAIASGCLAVSTFLCGLCACLRVPPLECDSQCMRDVENGDCKKLCCCAYCCSK